MKGTEKKTNGKRKVSDLRGKLRQKNKDGSYYYRLTIANGQRKEFALKTADFEEACKKFSDDDSKTNGGYIVNPVTSGYAISLQDMRELENYNGFQEFKNLAFVVNKLKEGVVSDPMPMTTTENKDAFRLVMVKKVIPSHKANLTDDYSLIQSWALNQKNQETISAWIKNKAKKAFIRIDEDFADCDFQFEWVKK